MMMSRRHLSIWRVSCNDRMLKAISCSFHELLSWMRYEHRSVFSRFDNKSVFDSVTC